MGKKIRREIMINGTKRWVSGNNEQEYAENLVSALAARAAHELQFAQRKHNFRTYAEKWFEVFSKPNVDIVTAITYERQLTRYIYPALGDLDVEDIVPADIQKIFNEMNGAKETKLKVKNVLNMILEQAVEDDLLRRNPLQSRSIRIAGRASKPTEPYSVEQMSFLVQGISRIKYPQDRAYLALHALHPLRLEEVLGLKGKDIDIKGRVIHIERAVTHPSRNQPHIKDTKTDASRRTIDLVAQIAPHLPQVAPECFVLGGNSPLTYTQVRRMCERIQRDTGFEETISPRRFRTTVLTDLYDTTKDIKQAQAAAGHTTATMTLKHYIKGRHQHINTASPIASVYGLKTDEKTDFGGTQFSYMT